MKLPVAKLFSRASRSGDLCEETFDSIYAIGPRTANQLSTTGPFIERTVRDIWIAAAAIANFVLSAIDETAFYIIDNVMENAALWGVHALAKLNDRNVVPNVRQQANLASLNGRVWEKQ
ncbi:MAG: hypothetical protein OXH76_22175 [Boseongicola sp.]|nr:hypothetical protein [Boseongicola sp.]MYH56892.1 hypothetical protein [Boseongicola sp. SB0675_bin_26]